MSLGTCKQRCKIYARLLPRRVLRALLPLSHLVQILSNSPPPGVQLAATREIIGAISLDDCGPFLCAGLLLVLVSRDALEEEGQGHGWGSMRFDLSSWEVSKAASQVIAVTAEEEEESRRQAEVQLVTLESSSYLFFRLSLSSISSPAFAFSHGQTTWRSSAKPPRQANLRRRKPHAQ